MLKKGEIVWVPKEKFEIFLQENVSEIPHLQMKKIAKICFDFLTEAVMFFINVQAGTLKCECFLPIFDNDDTLEQYGSELGDIDGCICLGPLVVANIKMIRMKKKELASLTDLASSAGFWQKDYAAVVFR